MSHYLIDRDGEGDLTLWRADNEFDDRPTPIIRRHARYDHDELWTLAVRGAGLDPAYELVERSDYDEMLVAVDNYYGGAL